MHFLYHTFLGRFLLKVLLHTKTLYLLSKWLHSPYSRCLIKPYIRKHNIDMTEFEEQQYKSYADFFIRKKKITYYETDDNDLVSPCDGMLSICPIDHYSSFYIKDSWYSLSDLIPDKQVANLFNDGLCLIFRLRASDYHHFCYIDDCYHEEGHFIPGMLHSVQPIALEKEPVYRLNRRMWSIMNTRNFGTVAQIEVGAVLVGGIIHEKKEAWVKRGDPMGRFELCGSTIILLIQKEIKEQIHWKKEIEEGLKIVNEYPVVIGKILGYK